MTTAPPLSSIDIVVTPYQKWVDLCIVEGLGVGLVQGQTIGYEDIASELPRGHTYANARDVHEASTAELTLALTLASQRGIRDFMRSAQRSEWAPAVHPSLADRRITIIGAGGIGKAIADRLVPFEVDITLVGSRARDGKYGPVLGCDIVILAVPLTWSTDGLGDAELLSHLKDGALVVDAARRRIIDPGGTDERSSVRSPEGSPSTSQSRSPFHQVTSSTRYRTCSSASTWVE